MGVWGLMNGGASARLLTQRGMAGLSETGGGGAQKDWGGRQLVARRDNRPGFRSTAVGTHVSNHVSLYQTKFAEEREDSIAASQRYTE